MEFLIKTPQKSTSYETYTFYCLKKENIIDDYLNLFRNSSDTPLDNNFLNILYSSDIFKNIDRKLIEEKIKDKIESLNKEKINETQTIVSYYSTVINDQYNKRYDTDGNNTINSKDKFTADNVYYNNYKPENHTLMYLFTIPQFNNFPEKYKNIELFNNLYKKMQQMGLNPEKAFLKHCNISYINNLNNSIYSNILKNKISDAKGSTNNSKFVFEKTGDFYTLFYEDNIELTDDYLYNCIPLFINNEKINEFIYIIQNKLDFKLKYNTYNNNTKNVDIEESKGHVEEAEHKLDDNIQMFEFVFYDNFPLFKYITPKIINFENSNNSFEKHIRFNIVNQSHDKRITYNSSTKENFAHYDDSIIFNSIFSYINYNEYVHNSHNTKYYEYVFNAFILPVTNYFDDYSNNYIINSVISYIILKNINYLESCELLYSLLEVERSESDLKTYLNNKIKITNHPASSKNVEKFTMSIIKFNFHITLKIFFMCDYIKILYNKLLKIMKEKNEIQYIKYDMHDKKINLCGNYLISYDDFILENKIINDENINDVFKENLNYSEEELNTILKYLFYKQNTEAFDKFINETLLFEVKKKLFNKKFDDNEINTDNKIKLFLYYTIIKNISANYTLLNISVNFTKLYKIFSFMKNEDDFPTI